MQRSTGPVDALSSSHTSRPSPAQETALSTFSPREVQSRVRAGASAEEVAAETGWPQDRVLRYAEPLLAERAYIAEQAQAVEVRRSGGGATLRQSAATAVGVDPESDQIVWDARRREDGKWVVSARFADRGRDRLAEWTYDHAGHNLHPLDDDARALMGVRTVEAEAVDAITDALDLIAERPGPTESRPRLVAVPDAEPEPGESTAASPDPTVDEGGQTTIAIPHPSSPAAAPSPAPVDQAPVEPEPTAPANGKASAKSKARKRRASVPSWDEILFGATKAEDE